MGVMKKSKIPAKVYECYEWAEAFSLCREAGRPIVAKVGNEIGKCFPSGRFEPKAQTKQTK
jgi:hypothetical protein